MFERLDQWISGRSHPKHMFVQKKVQEIECVHCHARFLRWSSTIAAYGRCDQCAAEFDDAAKTGH
ncbi:hypothetical protein [Rhizobium sp. RAF56]|jgi:hypothetical protein|uniref:hypothetical protein n=1 Tax=Rhizobium sp. RAF56 TaxID=3233062 RepID=UPI003F9AB4C2